VATSRSKASAQGPISADEIQDHLESARILMGEGILEEAKRILHRLLLAHVRHPEARQLLEELRERELKIILEGSESPRRRMGKKEPESEVQASAEWVMRNLDRDLGLGMFAEDGSELPTATLSLFRDERALDEFGAKMDQEYASCAPAMRLDIGIAFLEMGLHGLAVRHFRAAAEQFARIDQVADSLDRLSAVGLLSYALIAGGRAFDATIELQLVINDSDVAPESKLDLVYLMGRACEALGKKEEAAQWYRRAAGIDPDYRDVQERLKFTPGAGE
jgi:tetratricopeptide (TPR) repeat protein